MKDVICELADELCKPHKLHVLEKHIKSILKTSGVVENVKYVEVNHLRRIREECFFSATVKKEHNRFGELLTIIIKPDHSEKRVLRVVVQVGSKIYQKVENKDKEKWNNEKVYLKEERLVERYLKKKLDL